MPISKKIGYLNDMELSIVKKAESYVGKPFAPPTQSSSLNEKYVPPISSSGSSLDSFFDYASRPGYGALGGGALGGLAGYYLGDKDLGSAGLGAVAGAGLLPLIQRLLSNKNIFKGPWF